MKELIKYKSAQELKANSKPMDMSSDRAIERHKSFENSIKVLREAYIKSKSSSDSQAHK